MKTESIKLISIILFVTLLINPAILLIITDNFLASVICYLVALTIAITTFVLKNLKAINLFILSIFITISILLHAEAIFINSFKEYIIEDLYTFSGKYYFNRPYLKKIFQDKEFQVNYVTSKQGFRIGVEDNPDTDVEICDWMFLGDSYTQGAQVEYEDLYTSKLYRSFSNKIILNAGVSGWGLPDEFNYYLAEGYKFKPKKVFLQICNFNDFMNVNEREPTFTDFLMSKSEFLRFLLYPFKYANPAELPLGRWTEPFYPTTESNEDFNIFFKNKSQRQNSDLKNFATYLKKLNDEIIKNGSELIVLQIPTKEQLYYKYLEEVIKGFKIKVEDLDILFPNEFLSNLCKENSIRYLDLLIPLGEQEGEVFFQFDEHLNKQGHERLAVILQKFVQESIKEEDNLPQALSVHNSEDRYPIFHDVNLVSYQSVRDSNIELFTADSLLNNSKRITFNNVDEFHPWLDYKNQKVLFTEGDQQSGTTKIGSMMLNGTNREYLTKEGYFGSIPSFNKDHNKITYSEWTRDTNGRITNPCIVIVDLVTGEKVTVSDDKYESWRSIFSPDDEFLYFISKRTNNFDIYCYNFKLNKEENLTDSEFDEWDPFVSLDGKSLVYAGFKDGNWDIFILDLATKRTRQITQTLGNEWDTSFSPDGKHIYYAGVYGFMNGIYRVKNIY